MGMSPGRRAGLSYYVLYWISDIGEGGLRILKSTIQPPNTSES